MPYRRLQRERNDPGEAAQRAVVANSKPQRGLGRRFGSDRHHHRELRKLRVRAYPVTMPSDVVTKTCRMCCMEIPKEARTCSHCHHFQNRLSTVMFHPGFAVLFACLPLAAMLYLFAALFDTGENYESYKDQIVITGSQLAFGDTKSGPTVAVIGTIRNTSRVPWKEIPFHIDFLDAAGRRADVGDMEDYIFRLPANGTSSFKVSFRR